jgi:hypothetical protein
MYARADRVATLCLKRVYGAQASKKVQDTLVCIVAQQIDHALKKLAFALAFV